MKSSQILLTLFLVLITTLAGYSIKSRLFRLPQTPPGQITVTTSFYPLYYFTSQITGDHVPVFNLTPSGAEPHDFDPSPTDIARISQSQLLVINGGGFEPWADRLLPNLPPSVKVVRTADNLITATPPDPHVWLDPLLAQKQVDSILQGLIAVDPANATSYQTNARSLTNRLQTLHQDFQARLSTCQSRTIVTSHDAFGYLAARYQIITKSLAGLSPEEEPSPQDIARLVDYINANNIHYIFFETLISPKLAQTLAAETNTQTLIFNPLEGLTPQEVASGADYFSTQRQNLDHLAIALNCN